MVAKGHSSGGTQVAKMMRKVSKAVAPEVEDELLLHLAQTRYKDSALRHSELENFLAVVRIDAHRARPLDEASALLLAQNYTDSSPAFPYFTEITGLGYSDYLQFFAAVERLGTHGILETNLELGQFHSLIEWICLLRRRHAIDDNEAASFSSTFATNSTQPIAPLPILEPRSNRLAPFSDTASRTKKPSPPTKRSGDACWVPRQVLRVEEASRFSARWLCKRFPASTLSLPSTTGLQEARREEGQN